MMVPLVSVSNVITTGLQPLMAPSGIGSVPFSFSKEGSVGLVGVEDAPLPPELIAVTN